MTHITWYVATGIVFTITTIVFLRVNQVAIDHKSLATVCYPLPLPPTHHHRPLQGSGHTHQ